MPQKILIVDDDADMRLSLRGALESLCCVIEASSGPEALALLRRERPRALVLDISMPDMGGLEVLRAARDIHPSLGIVMLTGEMDLGIAREALECGARSYVTKPFEIEALRAEVKRLLEPTNKEDSEARPWRVAGE